MTQQTPLLTIDLSRANTLQGLTLVHFSAQPEPFWSLKLRGPPSVSYKRGL